MFAAVPAFALGLAAQLVPATSVPHRTAVEVTSQLSVGGGYRVADAPRTTGGLFSVGLRLDLLFGRSTPRSLGVGPFVSARVDNFSDIAPAAGLSLLLPVGETFPLVLSVGGVARWDRVGADAGVLERVWWGARSLNWEGVYALSVGLFVEGRQFFDASHTYDVIGGLDLDLELVAIPWILLYNALFRAHADGR